MKKTIRITGVLLMLVMLLQLFSAAPAVFAANKADDGAAVSWAVIAEGDGGELTLTSADEVKSRLGKGFSVYFGKNSKDEAITAPKVSTLRKNGVRITPPAGYEISSVYLVAEGASVAEGSRSLTNIAVADFGGKLAVTLPKGIFAEGYNDTPVGAVFNNNSGKDAANDSYVIWIRLEKLSPADEITVSYDDGGSDALRSLMDSELGAGASLVPGGDVFTLETTDGTAEHTVCALDGKVSELALSRLGKSFKGWRASFANGASAVVDGGDKLVLHESVTLEAIWQDVIVFSFSSGEKLYDGTPLTVGYERAGILKDGDTLVAPDDAFTLSRTDAGESEATVDVSRLRVMRTDSEGKERDVTAEYEFLVIPGKLNIIKRSITAAVGDVSAEYNGSPIMPSEYSLTYGSLVEGHEAEIRFSGAQTVPGSSAGMAALTIRDEEGVDVTANYDISVVNGTLTVYVRGEKQPVTVMLRDAAKEYDGTPLSASAYDVTAGALLGSDALRIVSSSGSITDVGSGRSDAVFAVMNGDIDVSENYEITVIPGGLTVKPREITLTADSASKPYDGTALEKDGFAVTSGSLPDGHSISAAVKGSQTQVGSSANRIDPSSVVITDSSGNDVTANYSVTLKDGTLTVDKSAASPAITVTIKDAEKVYDGKALSSNDYSVTSGSLADGDELKLIKASGSQTEVGRSSVTAQFAVMHGESDVSANYDITVVPGTLTVKPREITLTADSASKPFDGKALSKNSFTVSSGSLVSGHSVKADVVGSQTEIGSSANSIDAKSVRITDASGSDVTANYSVTLKDGTLTVEKGSDRPVIVITVKDAEKVYDGKALTSKDYSISSGKLGKGDKLTLVKLSGEQTEVGRSRVTARFAVMHGESDVTDKYELRVEGGSLTVKPRPVTLTADSASKTYDGTALTAKSFTISSGSLVPGHVIVATLSGSQTEIGSSANSIDPKSVHITDQSGSDVTANYSVTLKDGTLTVERTPEKPAIEITVKGVKKTYDGKALKAEEYSITGGALLDGDTLKLVKINGSQTDVGKSEATAEFKIMNGKKDVTDQYAITVIPGKLTVNARSITLTASSASKIYDGTPLTKNSFTISSGKLVKGHTVKATVVGSQTEPGSSANVIDKNSIKITDSKGNDVTANYKVTTAAGTLSVSKNPITDITLSFGERTRVYDGKPYVFSSSDVKVTAGGPLPAGYTVQATFSPEKPTDVGKYDITIKSVIIRDAQGNDVTLKYNISRVRGELEIMPRPIVIETKAANKVYDGTALTERSTPTITGRAEGHQITLRITGSQTKVGSSENTVADVKITDKETGADVTKNYSITYKYGMLTVTAPDGDDGEYVWISGSSGTLYFRLLHSYDGFEGIKVDGRDVDKSDYTSASGSTEIWLKASYLNRLSVGSHTLTAVYSDGETASTDFTVKGSGSSRTGDHSNIMLWIVVMAAALVAVIVAAYFLLRGKGTVKKSRGKHGR